MTDLVEFLRARFDDDERIAEAATQGRWFWAEPSDDSWPCGDEPLQASQVAWDKCPYYCTWSGQSDLHRGEPGKPGHEHLRAVEVIGSWGHDAYGLSADEADKQHIVTWQPSRALAEVAAKRAILAEALTPRHRLVYEDEWYSCSQAVSPDRQEDGPGSGCHDEGRSGKPCDCGDDSHRERLLSLLTQPYRSHPDFNPAWTEETP